MKFTVTSGAGVTEVADRPESAKAALCASSCYSDASETTFASLMRTAGVELRRIFAGWQPEKLRCCPMNHSEPV